MAGTNLFLIVNFSLNHENHLVFKFTKHVYLILKIYRECIRRQSLVSISWMVTNYGKHLNVSCMIDLQNVWFPSVAVTRCPENYHVIIYIFISTCDFKLVYCRHTNICDRTNIALCVQSKSSKSRQNMFVCFLFVLFVFGDFPYVCVEMGFQSNCTYGIKVKKCLII